MLVACMRKLHELQKPQYTTICLVVALRQLLNVAFSLLISFADEIEAEFAVWRSVQLSVDCLQQYIA
jgi:hypothetical protein